ncbi:molybdopterin-binding/glycosyltransferase family 2 protein [Sinorhizobium sp. BG8]|uniref:NTP transferase domain-containing protein n=1 Tax=Sinorhizobium sp. BG8 TaxID=2613773 RepID=UPI00193D57D7|nr:molybdopterin-binding/glycosyltransferase family 2 protein [Sinorhizobium sp. BG8]QRM55621.1 NTP transferase domain-containing protein [Sinorhizobium sp. BG8]
MIFGEVPVEEARGAILAHSVRANGVSLSKGHVIDEADCRALAAAGIAKVIAARLEAGDIDENEAARLISDAIAPDHLRFSVPATGRVNIYSEVDGLFVARRDIVDRFNRIDPAITIATLPDHVPVQSGDMVATVKIIPLAVSGRLAEKAAAILRDDEALLVKPFKPLDVALIATQLPSLKTSVMDKTRRLLEHRLSVSGSRVVSEVRVPHEAAALAEALAPLARANGMVVVFGASAVADEDDVIPAAIRAAGGNIEHVGMPVDPGNLLVLGSIGGVPVLGAPGCARSPKENGFDWILNRILAGERPGREEITGLGVGGLLAEIQTRPRPRDLHEPAVRPLSVAVVVLAAGKASRMGSDGRHKLLAEFDGEPLVRRSVEAALRARPARVVIVTGHRASDVEAALAGLPVEVARNPDYAQGMSTSLQCGLGLAGGTADGILVLLADMPHVTDSDLRALMDAFEQAGGSAIVRAVSGGKRGNPVILPRSTFPAINRLEGEVGARNIIEASGVDVIDVEIGEAAQVDVDTPEAVLAAGGVLKG